MVGPITASQSNGGDTVLQKADFHFIRLRLGSNWQAMQALAYSWQTIYWLWFSDVVAAVEYILLCEAASHWKPLRTSVLESG